MNTIKCFSLIIASTFLSTAVFSQNVVVTPVAELDAKPVAVKPIANNIPAPGTRVVATEPLNVIAPTPQLKPVPLQTSENAVLVAPSPLNRVDDATIQPQKLEAKAIPSANATQMQAKMTEEMKATMAGKTVRPKTIDQTTGATESKLTPTNSIPLKVAPVVAPVIEN
jgi:hypothetical protein